MSDQSDSKQPELLFSDWITERMAETLKHRAVRQVSSEVVERGVTPDVSGDAPLQAYVNQQQPLLIGRLAEYLSTRNRRDLSGGSDPLTSRNQEFTIDDLQERAVVALSLILTSHIVRFAGTSLSESALVHVRDRIMRTFGAGDAVRVEIEAYDLLSWFAEAMNDSWAGSLPSKPAGKSGECRLDFEAMIEQAVRQNRDLVLRYYTGARGEFSTRRITPIRIEAEKYLIAYCHSRCQERKFRLSRILSLSWFDEPGGADGPAKTPADAGAPKKKQDPGSGQGFLPGFL